MLELVADVVISAAGQPACRRAWRCSMQHAARREPCQHKPRTFLARHRIDAGSYINVGVQIGHSLA